MINITVVFKDSVLESVLTDQPAQLAKQVNLTICNLDSDDLNETEYKSLYTNPNNTEADSNSYRINNMHTQEER